VTRPGYPAEYVAAWALTPGMTVREDGQHAAHVVATNQRCVGGRHVVMTDGTEAVCGPRCMWLAVTA
jgi:hypothetical protein